MDLPSCRAVGCPTTSAEGRMSGYRLTQEDIDAIVHVFRQTLKDIPEGNFDDWLAQWTADARLMPPDMPDVAGHDELRAWMRGWPKIKRFEVIDTDVEGDGDLAVLIAHFVRVQEAPDGGESMENGRQILKFRRQDGRWLIAAAMFNADQP
jgi:ketosteroid isomerase-like protein